MLPRIRALSPLLLPVLPFLVLPLLIAVFPLRARAQDEAQSQASPGTGLTNPLDPRISKVLSDLERVRAIHQTALSPDGHTIAWVTGGHGGAEIWVGPSDDPSRAESLTADPNALCSEADLAWSPDSRSLAFTSACTGDDQPDIYLAAFNDSRLDASRPRRLTHLRGTVDSLAFSPDGKTIAFLYVEGATRQVGALNATRIPAGVIGEDGIEVQRVATVDVGSRLLRQVTPAALYVYEYSWSPDSTRLAYVAAPPPGENNWWIAQLYTQALTNASPQSIFDPQSATAGSLRGLQIAVPRWSPDGNKIAFIGGLMSDQGFTGGDLYVLPGTGGQAVDITRDRHSSISWYAWSPDRQGTPGADRIGVVEVRGGSLDRSILSLIGDAPGGLRGEDVPDSEMSFPGEIGDGTLEHALSLSRDQDAFAYIQSSYAAPPAVMLTRLHGQHPATVQITHLNDGIRPDWGRSESIEWRNQGFDVQGWLTYPADFQPGKKYPLVVSVHGGPSGAVVPTWPSVGYNGITFASLGYFVLQANPRGSFGQGESFTLANRKDFGYGDLRDILAGVDTVSAQLPIDPHRVGITGWSYGGYMTMFAVTQTHRFRAAVAGAGIANWQSYYGENSIDQWMIPFFGASVYQDPAVYAKSSPIDFIQNVRTPTLIVVGGRDGECPAPQSFEFWHALRDEHVPTRLVVYPNEGHRFLSPENRRDVLQRALSWFEQYMPADNATAQASK